MMDNMTDMNIHESREFVVKHRPICCGHQVDDDEQTRRQGYFDHALALYPKYPSYLCYFQVLWYCDTGTCAYVLRIFMRN